MTALRGAGVLVTRPEHQAGELVAAIEAAGGTPVCFPVLHIEPRDAAAIAADLQSLPAADIVVYTSRNAVEHGIAHHPAGASIAVIGPATQRAVEASGRRVDIVPKGGFDSESLLAAPALGDLRGSTIRIVRGNAGREVLADSLRRQGARVDYLPVYRRLPVRHKRRDLERLHELWSAGGIRLVTVMSVESFDNLWSTLPEELRDALRRTPLVTPSRRVIQTAGERLPGATVYLAKGPQAADMLHALAAATAPGTRDERET